MAKNLVYLGDTRKNRERPVPSGTLSGVPLLVDGRPCVTLTARGDAVTSDTLANGYTIGNIGVGGVGNKPDSATVAFDGTYEFAVAGVTTSTANETQVYITSGGALNLTATGNTAFGKIDYPPDYAKAAGKAPVRIGG
jgi:hypothetical protein